MQDVVTEKAAALVIEQLVQALGENTKGKPTSIELSGYETEDIVAGVTMSVAAKELYFDADENPWAVIDALVASVQELTRNEPQQAETALPYAMIGAARSGLYLSFAEPAADDVQAQREHFRDLCEQMAWSSGHSTHSPAMACAWLLAELATWCPREVATFDERASFSKTLALTCVQLAAELGTKRAGELVRALYACGTRLSQERAAAAE